ncbi:hypothetical protein BC567DRAFT_221650 [Phyllosticta citribraziliensis]
MDGCQAGTIADGWQTRQGGPAPRGCRGHEGRADAGQWERGKRRGWSSAYAISTDRVARKKVGDRDKRACRWRRRWLLYVRSSRAGPAAMPLQRSSASKAHDGAGTRWSKAEACSAGHRCRFAV